MSTVRVYFPPDDKKRAEHHAQELGLSLSAYLRLLDSCFVLANRGTTVEDLRENIAKGRNDVLLIDVQTFLAMYKALLGIRHELAEFRAEVAELREKVDAGGYFDADKMAARLSEIEAEIEKAAKAAEGLRDLSSRLQRACARSEKAVLKVRKAKA